MTQPSAGREPGLRGVSPVGTLRGVSLVGRSARLQPGRHVRAPGRPGDSGAPGIPVPPAPRIRVSLRLRRYCTAAVRRATLSTTWIAAGRSSHSSSKTSRDFAR